LETRVVKLSLEVSSSANSHSQYKASLKHDSTLLPCIWQTMLELLQLSVVSDQLHNSSRGHR
jgi:hypothetical protein